MSPTYKEVFIPAKAASEFDVFLKQHGGDYKRMHDPEDLLLSLNQQEFWATDRMRAKSFLEDMRTGLQSSDLRNDVLSQGERMIEKSAGTQSFFKKTELAPIVLNRLENDPEYCPSVLTAMITLFDEQLPEEKPESVKMHTTQGKPHLIRSRGNRYPNNPNSLLPNEISALIEKFGLTGEREKTIKELAVIYQASGSDLSSKINQGLIFVRKQILETTV